MGIDFAPHQAVYTGFLTTTFTTLYAAILQKFITSGLLATITDHRNVRVSMVPPTRLLSTFGSFLALTSPLVSRRPLPVTPLECTFTKAPKQMKSFVMAFSQFRSAFATALDFALVSVDVVHKFTWLFGSFTIIAAVIRTSSRLTFFKLSGAGAALNTAGTGDRDGLADVHKPEGAHV